MNLEQLYNNTLEFLVQCIRSQLGADESEIVAIQDRENKAYLYFDSGQLIFSLEGLYQQFAVENKVTYNQFRRMLYSSSLNQDLSVYHAKITNHLSDEGIHLFRLSTM